MPSNRLNLTEKIDRSSPQWMAAEEYLQGNIVKSHGREYSALILIEFLRPAPRARIARLARTFVTSAREQGEQIARYKANRRSEAVAKQLFGNLYLSYSGYKALGFWDEQLADAFPDPVNAPTPINWFKDGMEAHAPELQDPPRSSWDLPTYQKPPDAMLLLACDDESELQAAVEDAKSLIKSLGHVLGVENGTTLRNKNEQPTEPFGFADGISEPGLFRPTGSGIATASHDKDVRPHHVLVPDRLAGTENAFGSYLVYRKLQQHVKDFRDEIDLLAKTTGVSADYAGAMVMGRFKDGTPLTHDVKPASGKTAPLAVPDYKGQGDLTGLKCPLHAHIRKVNPRITPNGRPVVSPLFRRGVPYGVEKGKDAASAPGPVGLLFLCFQSDIARQFGFITVRWMENSNFVHPGIGTDPLLGNGSAPHNWPAGRGGGTDGPCAVRRFVTLKGGEFFFAPSVAFFRKLS